MSEESITCQIERINYRIEMAKLFAHWWIARAVTGEIKIKDISVGGGRQLTNDEKVADALEIAKTHINNIETLAEKKIELLNKLTEE